MQLNTGGNYGDSFTSCVMLEFSLGKVTYFKVTYR